MMRENGQSIVYNKTAKFHYEILEDIEAGIVLVGSEVKSLRMHNPNLSDAYATFINGELFLRNLDIPTIQFATQKKHNPKETRKLLLHRRELRKISIKLIKGLTLIPLGIYFNKRGYVKVKLAIAQGKKLYDKRRVAKEKDMKREVAREMKTI